MITTLIMAAIVYGIYRLFSSKKGGNSNPPANESPSEGADQSTGESTDKPKESWVSRNIFIVITALVIGASQMCRRLSE